MRTVAFAIALLMGGTAMAQTDYSSQPSTTDQTAIATSAAPAGTVVEPSNANPRRDERGIPVISMAAVVPAGWNGVPDTGTGMGGPLLDPNTGQPVSDTGSYPACSRSVTDKCVQTYERHRR